MMLFLTLKTLHILSAIILFGLGLGTVFYKIMADRTGNVAAIAVTSQHVVLADWIFTTPTVIFQPVSGMIMAKLLGMSLLDTWLIYTYGLYTLTGLFWLPVVVLQIRMRDLAVIAAKQQQALPALYFRYSKIWIWLGLPAFFTMITITVFMVFHYALWH